MIRAPAKAMNDNDALARFPTSFMLLILPTTFARTPSITTNAPTARTALLRSFAGTCAKTQSDAARIPIAMAISFTPFAFAWNAKPLAKVCSAPVTPPIKFFTTFNGVVSVSRALPTLSIDLINTATEAIANNAGSFSLARSTISTNLSLNQPSLPPISVRFVNQVFLNVVTFFLIPESRSSIDQNALKIASIAFLTFSLILFTSKK